LESQLETDVQQNELCLLSGEAASLYVDDDNTTSLTDGSFHVSTLLRWTVCLMKKRSQRRKHYVLAVVRQSQNFSPRQDPLPGAQDGQNLISCWWSLPSPTDPVWWRSMHAMSSYHGNRPTNKQINPPTNKRTHRQDRLQYTVPLSLARSVNIKNCSFLIK